MRSYKPFILNSCLCLQNEDVASYVNWGKSVAFNIGNSYISYSFLKETFPTYSGFDMRDQFKKGNIGHNIKFNFL